ncbi:MAG: carboxypeptidase regulatory-like domain-containing protein, partial [Vulcanimicrobiaceae bacterium]
MKDTMIRQSSRLLGAAALAVGLALACAVPSYAVNLSAELTGTVTSAGRPLANVTVTARGNNQTVRATTDVNGRFAFPPLALGSYLVEAKAGDLQQRVVVDLANGEASVALALVPLREIGRTAVSRSPLTRGSGSDVVLDRVALTRLPFSSSFSELEIQMPGAARGANGVVHINGDHGVINYTLDGVALPQELNRDIGGEINLDDLSFVDLVEGAYPAQDGLRFGSVFNLTTRAGTVPAGFDGNTSFGSYSNAQTTIGYHAPLAGGGGLQLALGGRQSTRGLDPPNFGSPHNHYGSTNQFARFTLPAGGNNFTNVTFINSRSSFQIPNDVEGGEPAATDDSETQADTFLAVQFRHALGRDGSFAYGPAYKVSRIQDFGDPTNDFTYGEALNVEAPPYGNGGKPTDCADALTDPIVVYLPTTCAISLADQRTAIDYILQGDYHERFGRHTVAAGASYDLARILKYYATTVQPGNFLAPLLTPNSPDAPATVVDDAPNLGNTYQSYVQDSWRISKLYEADYGLRYDFLGIKSSEFSQGFGGFSPRFKFTRFFGDRASIYG